MITIKNHNSIYFKIENTPDVKNLLDSYFTVYDKEFDPDQNCKIAVPVKVLKFDDEWIYIPISIAEAVVDYLSSIDIIISEVDFDDKVKLETPHIYEEFFSNREGQLDIFNLLKSKTRGVCQVPTGMGKGELLKALVDSFVEDGNILVIAPFSSICEELLSRFEGGKTGKIHNLDKVQVINPVGHVNSNRFVDPEWITWMNEVKMILIDESENINDSLQTLFEEQLTSYKYCYGFSASADKFEGQQLKVNKGLSNYTSSAYGVIKYVGTSLVYKKPTLKLNLNIIHSTFGQKRLPFHNTSMEFNLAIKNIISHENFDKCIQLMIDKKKDLLFIPVSAIKHGERIAEIINNYNPNINVVQWNASYLYGVEGIDSYETLKENAEKVDVIIATKIAFLGVDIPRISDVLLLNGTQYNTVVQPIGRAFRNSNPSVWLIDEINEWKNRIYKMCHYRRLGLIRRTYELNDTNEYNI